MVFFLDPGTPVIHLPAKRGQVHHSTLTKGLTIYAVGWNFLLPSSSPRYRYLIIATSLAHITTSYLHPINFTRFKFQTTYFFTEKSNFAHTI